MDLAAKQSSEASSGRHPLSFSNGGLKRHHQVAPAAPPPATVYRECLKNHAAALGGHALDGCGEFMPSPLASPSDPTSLKCAACGCHRNFHRRDDDSGGNNSAGSDDFANGDVTPKRRSSSSASPPPPPPPPPISSSFFPSAPHMLLALSTGFGGSSGAAVSYPPAARKRFRTKFSREQKEKMFLFAEKLGWKMQKQDEKMVEEFCNEIGVAKGVLKVWMHNNKHILSKKDPSAATVNSSTTENNDNNNNRENSINDRSDNLNNDIDQKNNGSHLFSGLSSSS